MVVYGTKVISDIKLKFDLPTDAPFKYTIHLSSNIPKDFNQQLTCGTYLHTTHNHKIYLFSDRDINQELKPSQPLCYEVDSKVRFYWYHGSTQIYYELIDITLEAFSFWFLHPFFPMFLSIEEYFVLLHGSAIEIDGKSILFLAPYKSGKSTLTHYIYKQGHHLITDDILPTFVEDNQLYYTPSHPYSRPFRQAQSIGYKVTKFKHTFGKIDKIYIIRDSHQDDNSITITPLQGIEKFKLIKQNSLIYTFKGLKLKHEKHLGLLMTTVDVYLLQRPWGKEYIHNIYEAIKNHLNN
jgi:hypothetical protein